MRIEIIELTTIYPMVYVIEEGSLDIRNMTANVICKLHIDDAEKMKSALNNH